MPATPQPMSIYHPDAAAPRRVETVQPRSSFVPPAPRPEMSWPEMAKAEGHAPEQKSEGGPGRTLQPNSTAGLVRAHIAANGPSTSREIAEAIGISPTKVSDTLGSMKRYGAARHADDWSSCNRKWVLT